MHPSSIGALARQRHRELLQERQFRNIGAGDPASVGELTRRPIRHVRRSVGSALVVAGTRLMAPGQRHVT
jgi:hypothetical protein